MEAPASVISEKRKLYLLSNLFRIPQEKICSRSNWWFISQLFFFLTFFLPNLCFELPLKGVWHMKTGLPGNGFLFNPFLLIRVWKRNAFSYLLTPLLWRLLHQSTCPVSLDTLIRLIFLSQNLGHFIQVSEIAQSCPTPCDPMDCSPPGSSVHGIFQARVLEWVAISFSKTP